ncbi:MAG TPA: recombinase family protein [Flavobacteriales bacterium]|nr:recombinase family protein [Flavobacteriales bacterium]
MRKRAALMSRVSSDEQAKGYSLGVQSEALETYCLRNDIEIVYYFTEDHSAKNFERPAFKQFLEYLRKNKGSIDLFLFTSWDRFSRNAMDAYHMIDRLKKLGIEAQSIEQPIDFSVPENKMMLAMYLVMPEVDNDRRSIKIRGGIRAALKAGRWCRAAPYGYRNTRDENNRPIIVPTEHAETIRIAFQMIAKGKTQPQALEFLNNAGVPVKKSRFSTLLRNPMYMGKIEVPASDEEPYALIEGKHDGIVSEKLFYQVQQVLKGNRPNIPIETAVQNKQLPLRGILKCSACGGKLTGSRSRSRNGTRHAYYHCNHCRAERYRAENANETMIEVLNDLRLANDNVIIHRELVKRMLNGGESDRKGRISKLQNLIDQQNERIERLEDNLADVAISSEDFIRMKTRFSNSRNQAQQELIDLKVDNTEKSEILKRALDVIIGLGDFYADADAKSKIKLLGSIFPEMIEFDGKKCRTTKINEAITLCLSIDKGFSKKENRILPEKLEVSGWVDLVSPCSYGVESLFYYYS